jgi:hypothetical protein
MSVVSGTSRGCRGKHESSQHDSITEDIQNVLDIYDHFLQVYSDLVELVLEKHDGCRKCSENETALTSSGQPSSPPRAYEISCI